MCGEENPKFGICFDTALQHISWSRGVDQKYIQTLLGHRDPKSTEVYLHRSNKTIMGIQSPFDREDLKNE